LFIARYLSAASTTAGSSPTTAESATSTTAARKAPTTIHPGPIAALAHASESSLTAKASAAQIPVSDAFAAALPDIPLGKPAGAALGRHTTSLLSDLGLPLLSDLGLPLLPDGAGAAAPGVALTGSGGTALPRHASATLPDVGLTLLAHSTKSTLAWISLIESLLRLAHGRPRGHVPSSALIAIGNVAIGVRHAAAVYRVVNPVIVVTHIYPIEVVAPDEVVVDHDIVAVAPSTTPSVATPTTTTAPYGAHRHSYSK
jgi:hypothetical protein